MKKNDIVYFVKDGAKPHELRYSLRSVVANFPYNRVWIYGSTPKGFCVDRMVSVAQHGASKWHRVNNMLRQVCANDEITSEFWLFNDDFFIMQPVKSFSPIYDGTIYKRIVQIEDRHLSRATAYTEQLRRTARKLTALGLDVKNYATHTPLLVNRAKAAQVLDQFSGYPMFRCIYGNYWNIGGVDKPDVKIADVTTRPKEGAELLSTSDTSFAQGQVGMFIREHFPDRCKYEL